MFFFVRFLTAVITAVAFTNLKQKTEITRFTAMIRAPNGSTDKCSQVRGNRWAAVFIPHVRSQQTRTYTHIYILYLYICAVSFIRVIYRTEQTYRKQEVSGACVCVCVTGRREKKYVYGGTYRRR